MVLITPASLVAPENFSHSREKPTPEIFPLTLSSINSLNRLIKNLLWKNYRHHLVSDTEKDLWLPISEAILTDFVELVIRSEATDDIRSCIIEEEKTKNFFVFMSQFYVNCYGACTHDVLIAIFFSGESKNFQLCQNKKVKKNNFPLPEEISSRHFSLHIVRRYHCKSFLISRRTSLTHPCRNRFWARAKHQKKSEIRCDICCEQMLNVNFSSVNCRLLLILILAELLVLSHANGFLVLNSQKKNIPKTQFYMVLTSKFILHNNLFPLAFFFGGIHFVRPFKGCQYL